MKKNLVNTGGQLLLAALFWLALLACKSKAKEQHVPHPIARVVSARANVRQLHYADEEETPWVRNPDTLKPGEYGVLMDSEQVRRSGKGERVMVLRATMCEEL